jgi:hypothetical protein
MRPFLTSLFILILTISLTSQSKVVYDSIIKLEDLAKIKSLEEIVKYPKTCKIHQCEFFTSQQGKLHSELWTTLSYNLAFIIKRYFTNPKSGDFFIIEFTKASCAGIIGSKYKFKII